MKTRLGIVTIMIGLALLTCSEQALSSSTFGYWADGKRVVLELVPDEVAVKFLEGEDTPEIGAQTAKMINARLSGRWLRYHGIAVMKLNEQEGLSAPPLGKNDLQALPHVEYMLPVFRHGSTRMIATDELILRFKEDVKRKTALAFIRESGYKVVRESEIIPNHYVVQMAGVSGISLLEETDKLYQHYLLAYAEPNFILILPTLSWADKGSEATISEATRLEAINLETAIPLPEFSSAGMLHCELALDLITPIPSDPGTWTVIKEEGFESPCWSSAWALFSMEASASLGEPPWLGTPSMLLDGSDAYWGRSSFRSYTGSFGAWCAAEGVFRLEDTVVPHYPNGMDSWMVYGPFSLADASWAQLRLRHWTQTESFRDATDILISIDGSNFYENDISFMGPSYLLFGGWTPWLFDLTDWPGLGDLTGQPQVWVAFRFKSNSSVTFEGTYLDDIQIVKAVPTDTISPTADPYSSRQWALRNVWQAGGYADADIDADEAWRVTAGSRRVVVAVIDTGVDLTHEDLSLVPGYDATGRGSEGGPEGDDAHGTACAGIVAATRDNGRGIAGVAPNVRIMPIRIFYSNEFDELVGETDWKTEGIRWAVDHGAHVLSNSWYVDPPSSGVTDAIRYAVNTMGRVVVFATGNNDSSVKYPATLPEVIAVGASSPCDERTSPDSCDSQWWWGSNYGQTTDESDRWPDVVAPGTLIYSTDITGEAGYSGGAYFSGFGGTSAATPHVAGVAALLLSRDSSLTPEQVKRYITENADDIGPPGRDRFTGYGRLNAYQALWAVPSRPPLRRLKK